MKNKKILIPIFVTIAILLIVAVAWFIVNKVNSSKQVEYVYQFDTLTKVEMDKFMDVRDYITFGEECYDDMSEYLATCIFVLDKETEFKADDWTYRFRVSTGGNVVEQVSGDRFTDEKFRYVIKATSEPIEFVLYDGYCKIDGKT